MKKTLITAKYAFLALCVLNSLALSGQDVWLTGFTKPPENPILGPNEEASFYCPIEEKSVKWQRADVFNPGAVVRNDTIFLFFRAEDDPEAGIGGRTSRIGLAYSTDGINFKKYESPVLYPKKDAFQKWDYPGGVEDPRVVELPDGNYVMLYTSWNKETARLSSAWSDDLINWRKYGPVFRETHDGRFMDIWSKSGSIVTELKDGRLIAKKIGGKYYMYWGELFVNVARSDNGISWEPILDKTGDLLKIFKPTLHDFDSHLVEPGPPALATKDGILLLYNGKNLTGQGAGTQVPEGTYCGGQALFSLSDPTKLIKRMEKPFICPDLPHEITGQYAAGTTFIQGLVFFKEQWFLYYGTADSLVGVAVKPN